MTLLDPATIARAEALGLYARTIVEGPTSGDNRSPFHGFSVEFSQHRQYVPGDDLRHLDWKILGRSDRYFVKRYQQETNYACQLLVDSSESMAYGGGESNKLDYARRLAACLAYLVLKQRDTASLRVFDQTITASLPKTSSIAGIGPILATLARLDARGTTAIPATLERIAGESARRGIVVLISDLLDDEEAIIRGIQHLTFAGQEVIVLHVMHHDELSFDFTRPMRFDGLEMPEQLTIRPADIRVTYLNELNAFRTRVREGCERANCHYVLLDTGRPMSETLSAYLAFRARVRK
ncbi:MAG: DUF58 domain-containing protein [Tepidisphaeraceae bacterium]